MNNDDTAFKSGGCLAYTVFYYPESAEQFYGEHSDLVAAHSDPGEPVVLWAYSEELCNRQPCGYCRTWGTDEMAPCPGVRAHAEHAFARFCERYADSVLESDVFHVHSGLSPAVLTGEIERQLREGATHAQAS